MIVAVTLNPAVDRVALVDELRLDAILRPARCPAARATTSPGRPALGAEVATLGIAGGASGSWLVGRLRREGFGPRYVEAPVETRTAYTSSTGPG